MFQVKRLGQQNEKIGNTGFDLRLFFAAKASAWSYGEFVSCDAINPKPKITFLTSYGQLIHDLSTPQREIERMAGGAEKGFSSSDWQRSSPSIRFGLRMFTLKL